MTEAEWIAATDPAAILKFLRGKASDRKLRLFAVACCNNIRHLAEDDTYSAALNIAERFADGTASLEERRAAQRSTYGAARSAFYTETPEMVDSVLTHIAIAVSPSQAASSRSTRREWAAYFNLEGPAQSSFLRDIFGNPFRPVAFDPAWRTPEALALANDIYAERAFNRMPVLADALEEAGCDSADVLLHCRGEGPHVKGCWVVDAVLGKE